MPDGIRVAVIDDHPLFREGAVQTLEKASGIAERTVKHHMTNIIRKPNVRNRVEAALKFCQYAD